MSPTDKNDYALVTQKMRPRLRRTVNTRHFTLPKPYRRKSVQAERPRWKRKLAFYLVSGLIIGTLISQVAKLAEEARRARALPIVVAASPDEAPAALQAAGQHPSSAAASPAPAGTVPELAAAAPDSDAPAVQPAGAAAPTVTEQAVPAPADTLAAGKAAPGASRLARKPRPPSAPANEPPAAPDPDVVLISAILQLAPTILGEAEGVAPACSAEASREAACGDIHGMVQ